MTITSTIIVSRSRDDVWSFLADPENAPRWDRSVARATQISDGPIGNGAVVETTSPGGKRQTFRVTAFEPPRLLTFRLLRSPLFKSADLTFILEAVDGGTRITHEIEMHARPLLVAVLPLLRLLSRGALSTDLEFLRRSLEEGFDLTRIEKRGR